jgi:hypothetical protein
MSLSNKWKVVAFVGVALALVGIAYTGYVKSYLDEESQTTFFLKKIPTFRMEFHDPFANEGNDIPIPKLTHRDRTSFSDYCKYRFGIMDASDDGLRSCQTGIPSYLK